MEELLTTDWGCFLTSEDFRDKQQWVYIVSCVYEQEREGCSSSACAGEGMQENLVSWSEWTLQRILSCLGSIAEGSQLPASCQSVANKWPADPSVTPSAGSLFPLWCWWLVQLSGGLVLDAFISPSCQSSVTITLLLLLIITIIIVWWQRCAEHLGRLWCRFPCRWGEAVQFSTLMWHSGI